MSSPSVLKGTTGSPEHLNVLHSGSKISQIKEKVEKIYFFWLINWAQ